VNRTGLAFCSLFLTVSLVAACVSVPSTTTTQASGFGNEGPPKKVAVLRGPAKNGKYDIPACVAKTLSSDAPSFQVVSPDELENLLFPVMAKYNPPKTKAHLHVFLRQPDVRAQLRSKDITHLIVLRSDYQVEKHGGGSCLRGCVGAESGKEKISLIGGVWDVEKAVQFGEIQVDSTGTSRVAAFLIPVGLIAFPEKAACKALVASLKKSWLKHEE